MSHYCDELDMEIYRDDFTMEAECDGFAMTEDNEDEFRMWQGLIGPHFTPHVSPSGNLTWTNDGGLPNPDPVNIKGEPGTSLAIKGIASTVGDLPADAEQGDIWLVGAASPYTGYLRNEGSWVSLGTFTITTAVQSVNGQSGIVVLDASDVGALPDSTPIPSKTSDLQNDSGFVNASGAAAAAPVQSVAGKTGNVSLLPSDVNLGTAAQIAAIADLSGTSIPAGADLNDYTTAGLFYCGNGSTFSQISNTPPMDNMHFRLEVFQQINGSTLIQIVTSAGSNDVFYRRYASGSWQSWNRLLNLATDYDTYNASASSDVTSISLRVTRQINTIFLEGYVRVKAQDYTAQETVLFSIPSSIKPSADRIFMGMTSTRNYSIRLKTNGSAVFNDNFNFTGASYVFINATFRI